MKLIGTVTDQLPHGFEREGPQVDLRGEARLLDPGHGAVQRGLSVTAPDRHRDQDLGLGGMACQVRDQLQ